VVDVAHALADLEHVVADLRLGQDLPAFHHVLKRGNMSATTFK
jgi:hypothetical protein